MERIASEICAHCSLSAEFVCAAAFNVLRSESMVRLVLEIESRVVCEELCAAEALSLARVVCSVDSCIVCAISSDDADTMAISWSVFLLISNMLFAASSILSQPLTTSSVKFEASSINAFTWSMSSAKGLTILWPRLSSIDKSSLPSPFCMVSIAKRSSAAPAPS